MVNCQVLEFGRMQKWRYYFLLPLIAVPVLAILLLIRTNKGEVLGLISPAADPLPIISLPSTASASVVATTSGEVASISAKPKVLAKVTPLTTPTPSPASSQDVNGFIDRFGSQYAVDQNVLRHIAICESGFNSSAINYIYVGLFQFDSTTWKNIRVEMGEDPAASLRFSAKDSVQTAAYALSKGKGGLWPNCYPH